MKILDVVVKRKCPACKFEEVLVRDSPPPWLLVQSETEGVRMHAGSHMEIRTDLRFICCEHCGNPVMYLHIDTRELYETDPPEPRPC